MGSFQIQSSLIFARRELSSYQYAFETVMEYCDREGIDHADEQNNEELVQFINHIQDQIAKWIERINKLQIQ